MRISIKNIASCPSKLFFIVLTILLLSLAGGYWIATVANVLLWLMGILVVLIFSGILLVKNKKGNIGANHSKYISLRQNISVSSLLFCIGCTVLLGWFVLQGKPLPIMDMGTSVLVTVLFSLMSIWLVWFIIDLPLLSFPIIFMGVTFMYTTSSLILYLFDGLEAFRHWSFVNIEGIRRAMPIVMLAFSSFMIGAFLSAITNTKNSSKRVDHIIPTHIDTLRKLGIIIYFTSMVVIIFLGISSGTFDLIFSGGYGAYGDSRRLNQTPILMSALLQWFLPWSLLILIGTSKNRRMYVRTFLLYIPAFGIMLLTGNRTTLLTLLLLTSTANYFLDISIDWRQPIIAVALVAILVPTMANLRSVPIKKWSGELLIKSATNQLEEGPYSGVSPIFALAEDMSTSYQTLVGTILLVPDSEPYRYGLDYLRSLVLAIPFASILFSYLNLDFIAWSPNDWVQKSFQQHSERSGWGYLQVAEAYLQFGVFGVIAIYAILGWVLPSLWWRLLSEGMSSKKLVFSLITMMTLLIWTRNNSSQVVRMILWGWILVYGSSIFLDRFADKNKLIIDKINAKSQHDQGRG